MNVRTKVRASSRAGFTLLEMLVALAVFALAAAALLNLAGENTRSAAHVERRMLAGIVADNLIVQAFALPNPPAQGETGGMATLARRSWRWTQTVAPTDDPAVLRVEVRVFDGAEQVGSTTAFRDTGA